MLLHLKSSMIIYTVNKPIIHQKLIKQYIFSMVFYKLCKCIFKSSRRYLPNSIVGRGQGPGLWEVGKENLCFIYNVLLKEKGDGLVRTDIIKY